MQRLVSKLVSKAGIHVSTDKPIGMHSFRHSVATSIYSNLLILSRYVGHTSISSTQYYLRLTAQSFPHIMDICEQNLGGMYASLPKRLLRTVCGFPVQ